ncbi:MAG: trimethylamine methyltransferase family protein [Planctomycetes bacterium]|jgi:trimethylamine--corrinoid protein Co-methyltransferase|nr:trimethylamine methyltransferase family protein [Planctomycetota bacterium]
MLKGLLQVVEPEQMERLHQGTLRVLERTGLRIQGEFLLRALADAGCRVDFAARRAWFKPDLVERQVAAQRDRYRLVRSSLWYPFCRRLPDDDVATPEEFIVDYGYGAPWLYDYPLGRFRQPTIQDQVDMIRLGEALPSVQAVNAPLICSEFDPRIETIESARLLLLHTRKPGWVGTSAAAEVKYLAELASLAAGGDRDTLRTQPPIFVAAYCTTSPLKIDTRSCDVLEEALKYGFPVNFAPMPILGATAPVTPAGAAIVAAAEILGGLTATSLTNPDIYYFSTSITGEMDMKTTQVCYGTPAAILTDVALHQLFRRRYGLVHNVEPGYVEARVPGLQAAFLKTYRQMAFGSTVSLPLSIGALDNGAAFSPTQAMLDVEMNEAIYRFAHGIEVNDDTCAVDLINDLLFCEHGTYLESEHTLSHFRQVGWNPRLFDRSYFDHTQPAPCGDERILRQADQAWRQLVANQPAPTLDRAFRRELDRIVTAAKTELLAP